jgi:hypothetical protein
MVVDHGLLHGMRFSIPAQALYRYEFLAIQRGQELNAGIDSAYRNVITVAIQFSQHDGTGSAVSLGTALLGTGSAQILPEELQYRASRIYVGQLNELSIEYEPNCLGI